MNKSEKDKDHMLSYKWNQKQQQANRENRLMVARGGWEKWMKGSKEKKNTLTVHNFILYLAYLVQEDLLIKCTKWRVALMLGTDSGFKKILTGQKEKNVFDFFL